MGKGKILLLLIPFDVALKACFEGGDSRGKKGTGLASEKKRASASKKKTPKRVIAIECSKNWLPSAKKRK